MIICGRISSIQLLKILGIIQCVIAAIITGVGITITVKFRTAKHEVNAGIAIDYIDNPWMTKYGGAIWMGLLLLIAGLFGSLADIKKEKAKYTYACLISNIVVIIFAIVLLPFSSEAISWFHTCQFTYQKVTNGAITIIDCPTDEKDLGSDLYISLVAALVLVIPIAIVTLGLVIMANKILFEECINIKVKSKTTHGFDQVYMDSQYNHNNSSLKNEFEKTDDNTNDAPENQNYASNVYL